MEYSEKAFIKSKEESSWFINPVWKRSVLWLKWSKQEWALNGTGRTQLKKMRIFLDSLMRVDLYVFEGEEFHYRCLDDVSARQSRKIEPLLPKNIRSCGMTYSLEEIFFRYFVTAGLLRKVQTLPHFKISMKKFYNFRQKKFMKIR